MNHDLDSPYEQDQWVESLLTLTPPPAETWLCAGVRGCPSRLATPLGLCSDCLSLANDCARDALMELTS